VSFTSLVDTDNDRFLVRLFEGDHRPAEDVIVDQQVLL
jgi:hypothetical protein